MNVNKIMPFHLFQYHDVNYIINIEKMQADIVDDRIATVLKQMSAGSKEEPLPLDLQENLQKLCLFSSEDVQRKPAKLQEGFAVTNIALLVTQACNLRCVYCYENKTPDTMNQDTAFQAVSWLISQSSHMKSIRINFFGGEPLLNFPLIKSVVEYTGERARETGKTAKFSITTNGTLLDNEKIAFLKEHHFAVMISFDGRKDLQDTQRPYISGLGSYDSVVPKIKKLLEVLPQTTGHSVILGNTSPEVVKDALQDIGFKRVSIAMNSQSLFTSEQESENPARDTSSVVATLNEEAKTWRSLIKKRDYIALKKLIGRSTLYGALLSLLHNAKKEYFCGAGRTMTAITPSGDVYLCHRFVGMDEYKLGNIHTINLDNKNYTMSPIEQKEACRVCFARYYCGGGCMHDHASSSGSIYNPDERMCHVKQLELELAASIVAQLTLEDQEYLLKEKIFPPKPCPLDF